jgi:hypothetical protein
LGVTPLSMRRFFQLVLAVGLLSFACRGRPDTPVPLPAGFAVQTLSGEHLSPLQMRGTPWVVNLWLPT